ncbi:MAG: hypothetical protein LBL82_08335 [Oscillospiraceae bacterium]|jgi:hypothetical protein|nr:hypothetical protein [Oscillospiraceae bacterium]
MYENLKRALFDKKISNQTLASVLGIHINSITNKIERGPWSIKEAFLIKDVFFPEFELTYLFAGESDGEDKSTA